MIIVVRKDPKLIDLSWRKKLEVQSLQKFNCITGVELSFTVKRGDKFQEFFFYKLHDTDTWSMYIW